MTVPRAGDTSPRISEEDVDDVKQQQKTTYLDEIEEAITNPERPVQRLDAPELVRDLSSEERTALERTLLRKIDLRLLPPVIVMYIMNYLDRNNIATARIAGHPGMQADLGLSDTQYETCVSILFVGYILMQVPSNLFLNKVGKPAVYLPAVMIVWGIISLLTAVAKNFAGLVSIRFFLGFVEAAYFPGCLFYLSCWYTRRELAFRSAILYSGSLISGAFAGLIAAGITSGMDGKAGLPAWRWLFIIEGAVTVVIAACAFFVLPNLPRTTAWLTERERQLAVWRLQEDIGVDDWTDDDTGDNENNSNKRHHSFFHGFHLAIRDVKVWILTIMLLGVVSAASVTNFFPSVVQTLGYNHTHTLLLTAPPYCLAVLSTLATSRHADRTGERTLHICIPLAIALASFILAVATTSTAPRYIAMMIMVPALYSGYVVILSWISNTVPRPPAKRAAALALINAVSNASSIYASYMYSGGPRYVVAFSVNCGTLLLAVLMVLALRVVLVRLNRKLDRGEDVDRGVAGAAVMADRVEAADKGFRFLV